MNKLDKGKVNGFSFKLTGWCRDKDGYVTDFTEKDIESITWVDNDD